MQLSLNAPRLLTRLQDQATSDPETKWDRPTPQRVGRKLGIQPGTAPRGDKRVEPVAWEECQEAAHDVRDVRAVSQAPAS